MTRSRALSAALAAAVCLSVAAQPKGGPTSVSAAADPGPSAVLKLPGPDSFDFTGDWYFEAVMRLDGVSVAEVMASREYAMRVWLDPVRMAGLNLSISDISSFVNRLSWFGSTGRCFSLICP